MEYTYLGRTGLLVSRLCLGTMNFGPHTSEDDSHSIMDRALEMDINFFDTANMYGGTETEKIIGRWFQKGDLRRDKVVLATKLFGKTMDWPNHQGCSALNIRRSCEESLQRLQTDYIDLYQMHHIDRNTPWEEIWQAMEQLVREGKILYVGSSNFAAWNIAQANEKAAQRHFLGLVSEQSHYNLKTRQVELEVLPCCREYGVGVIPWSPLAGGLLGGVLQKIEEGRRASEGIKRSIEAHKDQLQKYEDLCKELGEEPANVALAWLNAQPGVTAPIIGPRTMEQLNNSERAVEIELSEETLEKLDDIWPGPGNQAPEAYAW